MHVYTYLLGCIAYCIYMYVHKGLSILAL